MTSTSALEWIDLENPRSVVTLRVFRLIHVFITFFLIFFFLQMNYDNGFNARPIEENKWNFTTLAAISTIMY